MINPSRLDMNVLLVVLHIHPLIRGRDLPYLSGGGLPGDTFKFAQLHFHWGGNSSRGSEHVIGSTKYCFFENVNNDKTTDFITIN